MKLVKTLGLITVAAVASMAFLGASASADSTHIVLCKKAELNCKDSFPNPTTIAGHASDPKLLTSVGTVLCPEGHIKLEILNTLSTEITAHLTELTFLPQCKLGPFFNCTLETTVLDLFFFTKSGALTASVASDGKPNIHVVCGEAMDCTFGGKPALSASSTAGGVTTLVSNEAELTKTGGNCPSTSKLDATYTMLGAMWIES
jgi:hypothetical protein